MSLQERHTTEFPWVQQSAGSSYAPTPLDSVSLTHCLKWTVETAVEDTDLYYIKNGDGVYLTYEGTVASQTPVVVTANKQPFRILTDAHNAGYRKLVNAILSILFSLLANIRTFIASSILCKRISMSK